VEDSATGNLLLTVENTLAAGWSSTSWIWLCCPSAYPAGKSRRTSKSCLTLSQTDEGFLLESHPSSKPVIRPARGVYLAVAAEGPKDIKDSVTQAQRRRRPRADRPECRAAKGRSHHRVRGQASVQCLRHCSTMCPYSAIQPGDKKLKTPAQVMEAKLRRVRHVRGGNVRAMLSRCAISPTRR